MPTASPAAWHYQRASILNLYGSGSPTSCTFYGASSGDDEQFGRKRDLALADYQQRHPSIDRQDRPNLELEPSPAKFRPRSERRQSSQSLKWSFNRPPNGSGRARPCAHKKTLLRRTLFRVLSRRSPSRLVRAWTVFDFDQISTRPESAKEAAKSFVTAIIAAGFRSNIVCCRLWRKRHASDGQSNSERCYRCWPRGHSCDVAIGNTDSQRLRLARLNPTRYRGTHSNGARRYNLPRGNWSAKAHTSRTISTPIAM